MGAETSDTVEVACQYADGPHMGAKPGIDLLTASDVPPAWHTAIAKIQRLHDALNAIEEAEPVASWQIDGLHIWPILRQIAGSGTQRTVFMDWDALSPVLAALRLMVRAADVAEATDPAAHIELFSQAESGRVWFFGNTAGYTILGGHRVHSHFDTLRAGLEANGHRTHAYLMHEKRGDEATIANRWFTACSPIEDFLRAAYHSIERHWRHVGEELRPFLAQARAHPRLAEFASHELLLHPEVVRLAIARALTVRDWLSKAFEAHRPKAVVFYPGFTSLSYGLCAAARASGVRCFEMQHGIQGRMHEGYHWSKTPDGGWNCTAPGMLCWTERDSSLVQSTGNRTALLHGPGTLRLARHLLLEQPASSDTSNMHERLRKSLLDQVEEIRRIATARARKPVTFVPQYMLRDNPLVSEIESMIDRTGIELLRREHPVTELRRSSAAAGDTLDAATERVTSALLPAVLANSGGIVTGFSSTFLEASLLRRPTVSIAAGGAIYYSSYLRDFGPEMASFVGDAKALETAIDQLPAAPEDPVEHLAACLRPLPSTSEIVDAFLM